MCSMCLPCARRCRPSFTRAKFPLPIFWINRYKPILVPAFSSCWNSGSLRHSSMSFSYGDETGVRGPERFRSGALFDESGRALIEAKGFEFGKAFRDGVLSFLEGKSVVVICSKNRLEVELCFSRDGEGEELAVRWWNERKWLEDQRRENFLSLPKWVDWRQSMFFSCVKRRKNISRAISPLKSDPAELEVRRNFLCLPKRRRGKKERRSDVELEPSIEFSRRDAKQRRRSKRLCTWTNFEKFSRKFFSEIFLGIFVRVEKNFVERRRGTEKICFAVDF